jgi:hypothetical protein
LINFYYITLFIAELKAMCKERLMKGSGKKEELVLRLLGFDQLGRDL